MLMVLLDSYLKRQGERFILSVEEPGGIEPNMLQMRAPRSTPWNAVCFLP